MNTSEVQLIVQQFCDKAELAAHANTGNGAFEVFFGYPD